MNTVSLDEVVEEIARIKKGLPKNSTNARLTAFYEDNYDLSVNVTWTEYSIEGKQTCEAIAGRRASNLNGAMTHEPNSEKGKEAIKLYQQLIIKPA